MLDTWTSVMTSVFGRSLSKSERESEINAKMAGKMVSVYDDKGTSLPVSTVLGMRLCSVHEARRKDWFYWMEVTTLALVVKGNMPQDLCVSASVSVSVSVSVCV